MSEIHPSSDDSITFNELIEALTDEGKAFPARFLHRFSGLEEEQLRQLGRIWLKLSHQRRLSLLEDLEQLAEANSVMDFDAISLIAIPNEEEDIRIVAIRSLWQSDDENIIPVLTNILDQDENPNVRAQASESLGRFILLGELGQISEGQHKKVEEVLFSIMENEQSDKIRQRALESLGYSGHERVAGFIEDGYDFGDEDWQASALYAMGRSADDRWNAIVLERLDDQSPDVSREAARAAGELEINEALPDLVSLLHDEAEDVRLAAAWSLSQIGGTGAVEALEEYQARASNEDEIDIIADTMENLSISQELNDLPIFDFSEDDLNANEAKPENLKKDDMED